MVSIDPGNGHILAMASSGDYDSNQYNLAAQGHRQPGSAFKTFVLTDAINRGVNPYSTYYESKHLELDLPEYGHWSVSTADNGYAGTVSIAAGDGALRQHRLRPARPRPGARVGRPDGPQDGHHHPPSTASPPRASAGCGSASRRWRWPTPTRPSRRAASTIRRSRFARSSFPDGRVDQPEKPEGERVISEAVAYEVTKILHDNIIGGTGTAAYTGCSGQAGKTGTTDDFTDAWFVGYQPNLSTAVWVGYPDAAISMTSVHGITVFGGTFPAQIWNSYYANAGVPCESFEQPSESIEWSAVLRQLHDLLVDERHRDLREHATPRATTRATTRRSTRPARGRSRRPRRSRSRSPKPTPPKPTPEPEPTPPPPPPAPPPPTGGIGGG